jgi:hypothetical protein
MAKTCSYCGSQYSGAEVVCPVDQQPLIDPSSPAPADQALSRETKKVNFRALICLAGGALLLVTPIESDPRLPVAHALFAKQIAMSALMIGSGLYLQFRKTKKK